MAKREASDTTDYLRKRDQWIRMVVEDSELSHATVRIAIHIGMRINADDRAAWPSTKTMAKLTGVSVRAVIRAIDVLEVEGYLLIARKRNIGNRYWLRFKWE